MDWLIIAVISLFTLWVLWKLAGWQPLGRGRPQSEFAHGIFSLLVLMENGGELSAKARDSDITLKFVRLDGDDLSATLLLLVPKAVWSEPWEERIRQALVAQGFGLSDRNSGLGSLVEVKIAVPDIWWRSSGAKGAHAARTVLQALGVPMSIRFDFRLDGPNSKRVMARYRSRGN